MDLASFFSYISTCQPRDPDEVVVSGIALANASADDEVREAEPLFASISSADNKAREDNEVREAERPCDMQRKLQEGTAARLQREQRAARLRKSYKLVSYQGT